MHDDSSGGGVLLARPDEVHRLAQTLTAAFAADPMMRWFIPSEARWNRSATRLFAWYAARRIHHGTAYVTEDQQAAAMG